MEKSNKRQTLIDINIFREVSLFYDTEPRVNFSLEKFKKI